MPVPSYLHPVPVTLPDGTTGEIVRHAVEDGAPVAVVRGTGAHEGELHYVDLPIPSLQEPMSDQPHIYFIRPTAGIAGQFSVKARVGYEGEAPRDVEFVGSAYGGPVVMVTEFGQTFVTEPGRFGDFGTEWVRRFFESA
jgi:hypothetical protein